MAFRPSKVVGSAGRTTYASGKDGKPFLTKEPKLLLNNNNAGKPEYIQVRSIVGSGREGQGNGEIEFRKISPLRKTAHSTNTNKIIISKSAPPPIYIFDSFGLPTLSNK